MYQAEWRQEDRSNSLFSCFISCFGNTFIEKRAREWKRRREEREKKFQKGKVTWKRESKHPRKEKPQKRVKDCPLIHLSHDHQ
jgi:hypothetical protein